MTQPINCIKSTEATAGTQYFTTRVKTYRINVNIKIISHFDSGLIKMNKFF